jgi:hypothetical protein
MTDNLTKALIDRRVDGEKIYTLAREPVAAWI